MAYAFPHAWPEARFLDQIDWLPEQVREPILNPDYVEQGQRISLIERRQQIDIGVRPSRIRI
jgi:hypothetical protein